jgi:predicted PurR-regulated permease PerM
LELVTVALGKWVGFLALAIALYILWEIRQLLLLVFAAVIFATALNSVVRRLQLSGMKRGGAVGLSVFLLALLGVVFVALIVPPFISQSQELVKRVPQGFERLEQWADMLQTMVPGAAQYLPSVDDLIQQAQPLAAQVARNFFALFSNAFTVLLNLLLVLVLTIMLLVNPQPYRKGLTLLFPSFYRRRADQILSLCEVSLVNWVGGILINMVVIGIVSGVALWILGVPLVLANALLAGLLEAIPNVGPVLSLVPPMAIALLEAPWKAVAVIILYIVIQQVEQFLLVPFVMSRQVAILPAVTLLSQVVCAIFFGFLGLFLAIPLVIVAQIWIREVLVRDILDPWQSDRRLVTQLELPEVPLTEEPEVENSEVLPEEGSDSSL